MAKYTIRPNLNRRDQSTLHSNTLGGVDTYIYHGIFKADSYVVRPSGARVLAQEGKKTVHAGFIGHLITEEMPDIKGLERITYRPDMLGFYVGETKVKSGMIAFVGWKYYLIK